MSIRLLVCIAPLAGVYKVPYNLIFFPTLFFKIFDFLPQISVPFPSSPPDNFPYSLKITELMILLPLILFFTLYFTQKPLNYLPLFTTWNSSPKDLINFPPPGVGNEELYTPLPSSHPRWFFRPSTFLLRRRSWIRTVHGPFFVAAEIAILLPAL